MFHPLFICIVVLFCDRCCAICPDLPTVVWHVIVSHWEPGNCISLGASGPFLVVAPFTSDLSVTSADKLQESSGLIII